MPDQESFVDLHFPASGIDLSAGFSRQPNRPIGQQGLYARTTPEGVNVRAYESLSQRVRGGSRPGMVRHLPVPVVADWIIQNIDLIVFTSASAEKGAGQ